MRLKIGLTFNRLVLPKNYQHTLQGLIYWLLHQGEYPDSFHSLGFGDGNNPFKLFVFSNLRGKFELQEERIVFENKAVFSIASADSAFIQILYYVLITKKELELAHQKVDVDSISIEQLPYFSGIKTFDLELLSPVTAYRSKDRKTTYFEPGEAEFERLCQENLARKTLCLGTLNPELYFKINEVSRIRKKIIHFKNTFYIAYTGRLTVQASYQALNLIWNTGLSAKGSCGFGCVEVIYGSNLSVQERRA